MVGMRWKMVCAVLVMTIAFQVQEMHAQSSKGKNSTAKTSKEDDKRESKKSDGAPKRSSDKEDVPSLKTANIFIQPIDLVISKLHDVTFSFDVRVARFVTLGFDYRTVTGSTEDALIYLPKGKSLNGMRLRADAYLNGRAFTTSFVAQFNYSFYRLTETSYPGYDETSTVSGPGVLFGWRWFWSEPGESGLNVGLLLGAYNLDGENYRGLNTMMPDLRLELGYAF